MIFGAAHLRRDLTLTADVCVIGSGAGGAPVVAELTARGRKVIVLEAGSFWRPRDFTQVELDMFPRLYHDKAGRTTTDMAIRVHQGMGLGGSTLHNLNLCARVPAPVFARWRAEHGLAALPADTLTALYDELGVRLPVTLIPEDRINPNNRILRRGCQALGYRGGVLHHNRVGCNQSGFCELGCPFDAKQNALKVFLAPALHAGATALTDTWAERVTFDGRRATGVDAVVRDPATGAAQARIRIDARAVCVSASATGTAVLLQRSAVPDPKKLVGSRLHLHPGAAVAALFTEELNSFRGTPQSYECTQFLDFDDPAAHRVWIVSAFAHPAGVSSILGAIGDEHGRWMGRYHQLAALLAMVHDQTSGRVSPQGTHGVAIDYRLGAADAAELAHGLREGARLLLAAGAEKAIVPLVRPIEIDRLEDVDRALGDLRVRPLDLDLTSVHPMSTVWMGDDPARACVASTGRYHHLDNLYVADTSLFPSSIGVPPQLTAYALGLHVGRQLAQTL